MITKLINIFLILTFALQMLPVQQIGSLLFGNQLTEEVPHTLDDFSKDDCKSKDKSEFLETSLTSIEPHFTLVSIVLKELSVIFPHNHSTDIYSPPPNC